jgi:chromosome segregation ATPase
MTPGEFLGAAAAAAGSFGAAWLALRGKHAELRTQLEVKDRELAAARETRALDARAADATGRHAVAKEEVGMVPKLFERMDRAEAEWRAERARCERRIEELIARVVEAEARAEAAEARCEALATELGEVRRSIGH